MKILTFKDLDNVILESFESQNNMDKMLKYNSRCIDCPKMIDMFSKIILSNELSIALIQKRTPGYGFTSIRNAVRIFDLKANRPPGQKHVHMLSPARLYNLHS
jgi:hypothetical protein